MNLQIMPKDTFNLLTEDEKEMFYKSRSTLLVKYSNPDFKTININDQGDWIDLKCVGSYDLKKGDFTLIDLGLATRIPSGFEAWLVPRSGTFRKYGLLQTNSPGIIDESYCGNDDIWKMSVYATRDTHIEHGERLCQFRLMPTFESMIMNKFPSFSYRLTLIEVDELSDTNRGGFGSTGR